MDELNGLSILVVEDEVIFATETACAIVAAGGSVVGPAYSLTEAFEMAAGAELDGALLDLNLRNEKVFSLADALADRGVPIVFVTGEILPILDVDQARTVVVIKRSLAPGYAGIKNPLFELDNCLMVFLDAKEALEGIVKEVKDLK